MPEKKLKPIVALFKNSLLSLGIKLETYVNLFCLIRRKNYLFPIFLSYFFVKKIPLSRRVKDVMDRG